MSLKELKNEIHELVDNTNDETALKQFKENLEVKDWWNDLSNEQKKSVERASQQFKNGEGIPWEKMKRKYEKWLSK